MITLKQTEHSLLGSKKSIDALACAESARILVVSDSHGQRDLFRLRFTDVRLPAGGEDH